MGKGEVMAVGVHLNRSSPPPPSPANWQTPCTNPQFLTIAKPSQDCTVIGRTLACAPRPSLALISRLRLHSSLVSTTSNVAVPGTYRASHATTRAWHLGCTPVRGEGDLLLDKGKPAVRQGRKVTGQVC